MTRKQDLHKNDSGSIKLEVSESIIHPLSKYKPEYTETAARLIGANFSQKSLAYLLGVSEWTIGEWKRKYPEFKEACEDGKRSIKRRLVSNGLLESLGYEYETSKTKVTKDAEGNILKTEITTFKNKQPPNHNLLMFILCNLDRQIGDDEWKSKHSIEVDSKTLNVSIDGKVDSEQIKKLAGKILGESGQKQIESIVVPDEHGKESNVGSK